MDLVIKDKELMWKEACFFTRLLSASVRAAERAGQEVKAVLASKKLDIVDKGKNDVQTAADRISQQCIIGSLREMFSKQLTIIGEEGELVADPSLVSKDFSVDVLKMDDQCPQDVREIKETDVVVWVDPLDGTAEFTQGVMDGKTELLEMVTILIGIGWRGRPLGGVVHQPYFGSNGSSPNELPGRTIWAAQGLGAHGIKVTQPQPDRKIVVTTRSHGSPLINESLDALKEAGLMTELERVGGAGFKVLCALEKGAHAYIFSSPGTKKWDTCAPEAILIALNGQMTDVHGNCLIYDNEVQHKNTAGVIATPQGIDHQKILDAIPQSVKDKLPAVL